MSLSRAFTSSKRSRTLPDFSESSIMRGLTLKKSPTMATGGGGGGSPSAAAAATIRNKISGPVELISTTNMLSYNAPPLVRGRSSTSTSSGSVTSGSLSAAASVSGQSDDGSPSSLNTAFTTPDTASLAESPMPCSPEPNHLSCYFGSPSGSPVLRDRDEHAPQVPQRAASHTKRSTEYLARQRSVSSRASGSLGSPKDGLASGASSPGSLLSSRSSLGTPSPPLEPHPFGRELAQVTELAEEYRSPIILDGSLEAQEKLALRDDEEQDLLAKGFYKFAADDYMSELRGLYISAFDDAPLAAPTELWI